MISKSLSLFLAANALCAAGTISTESVTTVTTSLGRACFQDIIGSTSAAECNGVPFDNGLSGSASAWASAAFGILHAWAEAGVDGSPSSGATAGSAGAAAYFHDELTIGTADCSLCFRSGIVRASGSLAGGVFSTSAFGGDAGGNFVVGIWIDAVRQASCEVDVSTSGPSFGGTGSCSAELVVHDGDVVHIDGVIGAGADARLGYGPVYAAANFGDTGWISGLEVLDADHNPLGGVTVSSGSGVDYTNITDAAAVPEPGSMTLIGAGVLLVAISRRATGNSTSN